MFGRDDNTARFFVSGKTNDDANVKLGLAWLIAFASEHGHARGAVVLPTVRHTDYLARVIGEGAAKRFQKHRQLKVGEVTLEMFTQAQPPHSYDGPVLAVWTTDKALDRLDTSDAPGLCAAPTSEENISAWKANWNPVDVRTGESGSGVTVANPVVVKGLEHLSDRINLSSGLTYPTDRAAAINLFRLLHAGGEDFVPGEVRAWAVRNGWRPDDARELEDVAEKVKVGRRLRVESGGEWSDDALETLRAEAASL